MKTHLYAAAAFVLSLCSPLCRSDLVGSPGFRGVELPSLPKIDRLPPTLDGFLKQGAKPFPERPRRTPSVFRAPALAMGRLPDASRMPVVNPGPQRDDVMVRIVTDEEARRFRMPIAGMLPESESRSAAE